MEIRTDGRPAIVAIPRDGGGFIISQGRNRLWLSAHKAATLAKAIGGDKR